MNYLANLFTILILSAIALSLLGCSDSGEGGNKGGSGPPPVMVGDLSRVNIATEMSYDFNGECTMEASHIFYEFRVEPEPDSNDAPLVRSDMVACEQGAWQVSGVDLSIFEEGDITLVVTVGNYSTPPFIVIKDTTSPQIALDTPNAINSINITNYTLEGNCEDSSTLLVIVNGDELETQPTCSNSRWVAPIPEMIAQNFEQGAVNVTVDHTDIAGNAAEQIQGSLTKDTQPPTIAMGDIGVPTDATYIIDQFLEFSVNFSESVVVTGTPRLHLDLNGTTGYAQYASNNSSTELIFRYMVQSENEDNDGIEITNSGLIDYNGGSITDEAGNPVNTGIMLSVPSLTGVIVNGLTPTVSLNTPGEVTEDNENSFPLSGNCNVQDEEVTVSVGGQELSTPTHLSRRGLECHN